MKFYLFLATLSMTLLSLDAVSQHSLSKLMYPINTDVYDEICPILSFDEDELYFTRVGSPDFDHTLIEGERNLHEIMSTEDYNRKLKQIYSIIAGREENPIGSSFNQDVWYSDYYDGEVYNIIHPVSPLNNALPNSICSHYGKTNGYVVINQFPENGGIQAGFSVVEKVDNLNFTFPTPIEIRDFDMQGDEINISMSADKNYIIMAMKGKGSRGKKDLYLSVKGMKDVYSPPVRLSDDINSAYNEGTPFFSQDKKKLYFSSDRPGGIGGMDIYVCDRVDYSFKKWSKPRLLGRPVNSEADDSHPYVAIDENSVLFTSNRDGSSDIFYAKLIRSDSLNNDIDINLYTVSGKTGKKVQSNVYWGPAYQEDFDGFFRARDGEYQYTFEENKVMQFKAENRGAISDVLTIDPQELQEAGVKRLDIELVLERGGNKKPIFKRTYIDNKEEAKKKNPFENDGLLPLELNSTVVLKNIYFARAAPEVLPPSFPSLQKLAKTLKRRPDVVIQIEGHTDNVGGIEALEKLSYRRAEAISDYLAKAGVSKSQLRTKGYGGSRPITDNSTEELKSKNRRVEIRVLKQGKED